MFGFKNYGNNDTRSGFGLGLVEAASKNKDIVALCADLTGSLKMNDFKNKYPNRFFQIGIAEANMIGIAAGMTIGKKFLIQALLPIFQQEEYMIKDNQLHTLIKMLKYVPHTLVLHLVRMVRLIRFWRTLE